MKEKLSRKKIIIIANSSWYIYNFRLALLFEIRKNHDLALIAPRDKYTAILEDKGFPFYEWKLNRNSINIFAEIKSILSLSLKFRNLQPDLIHNFTIKPIIYGTIAAKINNTKNIVNAITGLGNLFLDKKFSTKFLRIVLKPILVLILNNEKVHLIFQNLDDKYFFENLGIRKSNSNEVIPGSGVDMNHFKSKVKANSYFNDPIKLLFPSRIIKEKGIQELIIAHRKLCEKGFLIKLLIAGEIDYGNRSHIDDNIKNYMINNNNIYLLGHIDDIKSLYEEVDIVVLPSWREGLSRSIIEAGAMSKPIITTNVPGCKEIVENGINGILVPPKDPKSLENAIESLIKNSYKASILGKNIRKKIKVNFEVGYINKLTLLKYKRIFNS